ncbi:MAG: hypothetical protein KDD62_01280 [Bdellovibrionales bacterium]|nr:hypothetical protein [Bdellovibrionales bacterium]
MKKVMFGVLVSGFFTATIAMADCSQPYNDSNLLDAMEKVSLSYSAYTMSELALAALQADCVPGQADTIVAALALPESLKETLLADLVRQMEMISLVTSSSTAPSTGGDLASKTLKEYLTATPSTLTPDDDLDEEIQVTTTGTTPTR